MTKDYSKDFLGLTKKMLKVKLNNIILFLD
jgi:hypothetical protein